MKSFKLFVLAAFVFTGPAFCAQNKIVTFRSNTRASDVLSPVLAVGGKIIKDLPLINGAVISVPDRIGGVASGLLLLASKMGSGLLSIEDDVTRNWLLDETVQAGLPTLPEFLRKAREDETVNSNIPVPETPVVNLEASEAAADSEIPWGISRVNAPAAWNANEGEGVLVAVVDTGIDLTHPDLAANIAGSYNVVVATASAQDDNGHGTHVSGTIAALLNGKGVAGVAPKAKIYAVKVLDTSGSGTLSNVVDGINRAVKSGAKIMNMSLGSSSPSEALAKAVKAAADAGVTVICAAGNNGGAVGYPAANEGAVAISASDSKDQLASFSSRGPQVKFIAPGVAINSTFKGGKYRSLSGTSMASPHVAGLAALAAAAGNTTPEAILNSLNAAATPLAGLTAEQQGVGLIDAAKIK